MGRFFTFLTIISVVFLSSVSLYGQKKGADSLLRMMEANSAHLQEINGISYRKVVGPARFLHNDTYLLCDTALWNVNTNVIDAIGHVQIIQENTVLKSDRIEYLINENLAKFRGGIVELFDKDGNILRTNFLDYNTKDSIGTFYNGGALLNNDGNLIESINGLYNSKEKLFTFSDNVNMFTDSVFIQSDKVDYKTDINKAYFGHGTTAWQNDNILFANSGEFDRPADIFTFNKDGYILTQEQEIWSDTLKYFRKTGDADLYNNVQIVDTVQTSIALADKATYRPNPMVVELMDKPVVGMYSVENGVKDTLFLASDYMKYYTRRYCDIDSTTISQALERKKLAEIDPILEVEKKSREAREKKTDNKPVPAGKTDIKPGNIPTAVRDTLPINDTLKIKDSLKIASDSLKITSDSLKIVADSLILTPKDTSAVTFMDAYHNVKFFRRDLQGLCDSLIYTGIDSIARFYKDPVMWNDIKNQFTSDSMQVIMKNNALSKANLLSNAFIISQEDSAHFNQIKSPEMTAFFANNDLFRFDALGGVSAIFYLQEDSIITTMNQKESKMLSVSLKDRKVQRLKYIEQIKNDAHPVFNLGKDKQQLRGFNWRDSERPKSRYEITERGIKPSKRSSTEAMEKPNYTFSAKYFPARRDSILTYMAYSDSLRAARILEKERAREQKEAEKMQKDISDSSNVTDIEHPDNIINDTLLVDKGTVTSEEKVNVTDKALKKELRKQKREEKRLEKARRRLEAKQLKKERREQRRLEKSKRRLEAKQKRYTAHK